MQQTTGFNVRKSTKRLAITSNFEPMDENRFLYGFNEIVRVDTSDPDYQEIDGQFGVIVGRSESPEDSGYAVFIYRDEIVWDVSEQCLLPTGRFEEPEKPTHFIRVSVDQQGRGDVVGFGSLEDE